MSRTQHVDKNGMKKGPWSKEEDDKLRAYIQRYGHWNWREIPRFAGVARCGKSCRLRWMNYLRPNMKHGNFTKEEEDTIVELHNKIGNKWSTIAAKLSGRSDNEIKNYWNTHLKKRGKRDKNNLKNVHDESQGPIEANPINTPNESSQSKDMDEVEALWASISSNSSSFLNGHEYDPYLQAQSSESLSISSHTSSADMASSMFSVSDCLISSGDSIQNNSEFDGNFWTEPLFPDYDSLRSTEHWADMDVVNSLIAPTDMTTNDEFLWSSIDLYSEYHSQLMN